MTPTSQNALGLYRSQGSLADSLNETPNQTTERNNDPSSEEPDSPDLRSAMSNAAQSTEGIENVDARKSLSPSGRPPLRGRLQNLSRSQRNQLLLKKKTTDVSSEKAPLDKEKAKTTGVATMRDETAAVPATHRQKMISAPPPTALVMRPRTAQKRTEAKGSTTVNRISLHVYDLIAKDALMLVPPFGCIVEIGQCFANVNAALHELGTGAYHVGVEVNGIEYAYGATTTPGRTGVFTCFPKTSPGYQYRTTIDLGERPVLREKFTLTKHGVESEEERTIEATVVLKEMAYEYMGSDYHLLKRNCCSFACDVCQRLGVPEDEIPSWFRNLAESGAATQDAAIATIEPIASIASALSTFEEVGNINSEEEEKSS